MFRHTAHIYDLIYEAAGKDYAAESSAIRSLIQARNPEARNLLDVACGTESVCLAPSAAWATPKS